MNEQGKRYPLNVRTTKKLRDRLTAEAKRSGRSLTQELEHRLEQSMLLDIFYDLRQEIANKAGQKEVKTLKVGLAGLMNELSILRAEMLTVLDKFGELERIVFKAFNVKSP